MNGSNKNFIALVVLDLVILVIAVSVLAFRYMTLSGSAFNFEMSKPLSTLKQISGEPSAPLLGKPAREADYGSENNLSDLPGVNEVPEEPKKAAPPQLPAAAKTEGKDVRRIGFTYFNSKCRKVDVIGDFNGWIPAPMEKINAKQWAIAAPIAPGEYAYNFVVDGRPIIDPNNPKTCNVGRGFTNSLLRVKSLKEH